MKEKERGEKRKTNNIEKTKKNLYQILVEEFLQICIFLGDLLQGKILVGASSGVEAQAKYLRRLNFVELGKTLSKIRIPLSLFLFC